MNLSSIYVAFLVLVVVLMVVMVSPIEAARKKDKRGKPGDCKYSRKGEEGPCDATTNTKEITLPLKRGDHVTCPATKVVSKPCNDTSMTKKKKIKGCKYEKKGSEWTECDPATNERSKVMKLKAGSPTGCNATRTKTKSCGGGNKKKASRKNRKEA